MPRPPKTLQIDEEQRFLARVAWAYHVEGLTQGAVAEKLGVTRLRINKALAEARRQGMVRVTINSDFAPCIELEEALKRRFHLREATIAPSPSDPNQVQTIVGTALGHSLHGLLAKPETKLFGMSWGNTLNLATRFMEPLDRPDLEIVATMGGLTQGSDLNSFEITTRLADLCNAKHSYFTAPLYAGTAESRDTMMELDVIAEILRKIRGVDALVMAAGDLSERSILVRHGLPADVSLADLRAAGAVGDLQGYFLDAAGQPVDHPINERVIGINLDDLRPIANVVLAAGGAHKVPILRAVLSTGVVDSFVSDELTARKVLASAPCC